MSIKSKLQLIALNQLNHGETTGYDMSKLLPNLGWPCTHQQVYRDLNKLKESGYAEVKHILQEDKPDKKVYSITPKGKSALVEAFDAEVVLPKLRDDAVVQLFIGNVAYFERMQAKLEETITDLKAELLKQHGTGELVIERLIMRHEADLEWVDSVIDTLKKKGTSRVA